MISRWFGPAHCSERNLASPALSPATGLSSEVWTTTTVRLSPSVSTTAGSCPSDASAAVSMVGNRPLASSGAAIARRGAPTASAITSQKPIRGMR